MNHGQKNTRDSFPHPSHQRGHFVSVTEIGVQASIMNGHVKSVGYADRLEAFKRSDAEREALVAELVKNYQELQVRDSVCHIHAAAHVDTSAACR